MAWGYGTIRITADNMGDNADTVREAVSTLAGLVADNTEFDIQVELIGVED
jgi:hypothetical protein